MIFLALRKKVSLPEKIFNLGVWMHQKSLQLIRFRCDKGCGMASRHDKCLVLRLGDGITVDAKAFSAALATILFFVPAQAARSLLIQLVGQFSFFLCAALEELSGSDIKLVGIVRTI